MSGFTIVVATIEVILAGRSVGVTIFSYLCATMIRFIAPIIATGGVFICLRKIASYPTSYVELLMHSFLPCLTYLVAVWLIALDSVERKFIWNILAKRVKLVSAK